jgi:hypothetical protein
LISPRFRSRRKAVSAISRWSVLAITSLRQDARDQKPLRHLKVSYGDAAFIAKR